MSAKQKRTAVRYLDSELYVDSESHARFSWQSREYDDGELALDDDLRWQLTELEYDAEAYGRELFAAVFPKASPLRDGLREALANAQSLESRLRLRLHLAPGLSSPVHGMLWELLFDPDRKVALGRSPDTAFSRYSTVPLDPGQPTRGRPRVLALIAAPNNAERFRMAPIDREPTRERLELAFTRAGLDVDVLEPPATPSRLREQLAGGDYHALHVFGHGLISQRGREAAALMLENDSGAALPVDENLLSEIFLGERGLRLVTLVACHGGALSSNDAFSGLAARLVERGIPAVIGMCRAVTFDLGHLFTDHLYRGLARSGRVDAAVNEARQQLYLDRPKDIDWSSPVLYMRLPDGLLWSTEDSRETASEPVVAMPPPAAAVPAPRPWSWFRQAALALATAALLLVVWPASEAAAELDLVVSRVAFTLARKQPLDRFLLRELATTALDEIRLSRALGGTPRSVRRADIGHPLGVLIKIDANREPESTQGERKPTLTLQKKLVPAGRLVSLEHAGGHFYRLSIDTPQDLDRSEASGPIPASDTTLELSAAISGPVRFKLLHEAMATLDAGDGETVDFISRSGQINLDVELAQHEETDRPALDIPALEISALSLRTIVETPDPESTYLDEVSTIQSGSIILEASGHRHDFKPREELHFSTMTGSVNRLEPGKDGIAVRLRGTFTDLEVKVPGGAPRRATVLGLWIGKGPSRALLVAAVGLLVMLLLSVFSRSLNGLLPSILRALNRKTATKDHRNAMSN